MSLKHTPDDWSASIKETLENSWILRTCFLETRCRVLRAVSSNPGGYAGGIIKPWRVCGRYHQTLEDMRAVSSNPGGYAGGIIKPWRICGRYHQTLEDMRAVSSNPGVYANNQIRQIRIIEGTATCRVRSRLCSTGPAGSGHISLNKASATHFLVVASVELL
ncbi:hypothetical protein J6590_066122 [Homalodisca vitripennis]|nr:hypothetical protein J6590_066122 [Homalodisca vitripennis]